VRDVVSLWGLGGWEGVGQWQRWEVARDVPGRQREPGLACPVAGLLRHLLQAARQAARNGSVGQRY